MTYSLLRRPKPRPQERRIDEDESSTPNNTVVTAAQGTSPSKASTKETPFPLLDLPPEIREKIYILICTYPWPKPILFFRHRPKDTNPIVLDNLLIDHHFPYSLVLTCQQLYHEVRPIYWRTNTFCLRLGRNIETLDYFLAPPFQDNRREVRSLRLEIRRWGKGDFFVDSLAPALEDMVLNGRLREVEVWLEKDCLQRLDTTECGPGAVDKMTGKSLQAAKPIRALYRLQQILQDPYLEKVIIKANRNRGFWSWRVDWGMTDQSFEDEEMEDVTSQFGLSNSKHTK